MKTSTMRRVVGGATVLILAAFCLTLTKAFGQQSFVKHRQGGGETLQKELEVAAFVKNFFVALGSERLTERAADFFAADVSFHTLEPDTKDGFFAKKFRKENSNKHPMKLNAKRWDELSYLGLQTVESITSEYLGNLPADREWKHTILMMKEVSEGSNLLIVEGSIKLKGDSERKFIDTMLLQKDVSAPLGFKVRSISTTRSTMTTDEVKMQRRQEENSGQEAPQMMEGTLNVVDAETRDGVQTLLMDFYDGMASDRLSTDADLFFTKDASANMLIEKTCANWAEGKHSGVEVDRFMKSFMYKLPVLRTWTYEIVMMKPVMAGATFVTVVGTSAMKGKGQSGFVDTMLVVEEGSSEGYRIRYINSAIGMRTVKSNAVVLSESKGRSTSSGLIAGANGNAAKQDNRWIVSELLSGVFRNDVVAPSEKEENAVRLFMRTFFESL
eukprot:GHVS01001960.1.p1 GENE.GHVS01001960.1~~GHVS01001960.1.p1  ORF type:complete len:442 (-),score=68.89 GHVS01001960.1:4-1329(-)